jgi:hypothetical protein
MTIDTVHSLQGAEKPVVIFSMVETASPADRQFYDDGTNLINVAVSRAKDMFIVAMSQEAVDHARTLNVPKLGKPSNHLWHAVVTEGSRLNMRHVVIVESPAKCNAVHQALGGSIEWEVVSTEGHVAELAGEASWDAAKAAAPSWGEIRAAGARTMKRLQSLWSGLATLYVATDPDPEGEAIAWHWLRLLKEQRRGKRQPVVTTVPPGIKRMRFYNLTPADIRRARDEAGNGLDEGMVKSALARSFLDQIIRLHYANRLGLGAANQPMRGVGRVQLGVLDLVAQAGRRGPVYRTGVAIPLSDGSCLSAYLCTSPQQGDVEIHGARDQAKAQAIVNKLRKLFARPDVAVTLSWSGRLHQHAPYPAVNTARCRSVQSCRDCTKERRRVPSRGKPWLEHGPRRWKPVRRPRMPGRPLPRIPCSSRSTTRSRPTRQQRYWRAMPCRFMPCCGKRRWRRRPKGLRIARSKSSWPSAAMTRCR